MSDKIEVNYIDLYDAVGKLKTVAELIVEAEKCCLGAAYSFSQDYEGKGINTFCSFIKGLSEDMDKLSTYYQITSNSILFAIEQFKEVDMNEALNIGEGFSKYTGFGTSAENK